jgi:hypothetical protein
MALVVSAKAISSDTQGSIMHKQANRRESRIRWKAIQTTVLFLVLFQKQPLIISFQDFEAQIPFWMFILPANTQGTPLIRLISKNAGEKHLLKPKRKPDNSI